MGLLSPRGSQITTTTVEGTGYAMIMKRERCLLVLEFFFCFLFDQGIGSRLAAWASRVDVVWVSVCVSSVVGWWSLYNVLLYSCGIVCLMYVFPSIMKCWCNDIHLAKAFQYAVLSLVGPSSLFRIVSHIGRDKLVIRASTDHRSPLDCWPLLSLEKKLFRVLGLYISESRILFTP